MGLFDFFKKANDDHIQNTTTIRYATDAQPANSTAAVQSGWNMQKCEYRRNRSFQKNAGYSYGRHECGYFD